MTLIELLFFLTPFFLTGLLWKIIFWRLGPWGAVASIVLGFGMWGLLWATIRRWGKRSADRRLNKP
jgi:hypothetical protein